LALAVLVPPAFNVLVEVVVEPLPVVPLTFLLFFTAFFEEVHPFPLPIAQDGAEDGSVEGAEDAEGAWLSDGAREGFTLIDGP
jgi:hypothetical protein